MGAWLNGLMNSGSAASTDYGLYPNWFPTGVWQGTLAGYYEVGLYSQGYEGDYWSSTAYGTGLAYGLFFYDVNVYPDFDLNKFISYAVRCAI